MMDEKLLNYKGVVVRKSDRRILENGDYLNNRIIEFYFRYLSHSFGVEDILLVSPSVSSVLTHSSNAKNIKECIDCLRLDQRKLIFFPINDNDDIISEEEEVSSHWSLLVYYRRMHSFVHHDSLGGINDWQARKLYENVKDYVGYGGSRRSLRNSSGKNKRSKSEPCFTESFTPQQTNGYDSGLYVMAIADAICEWFTSWSTRESLFWLSALEKRVADSYVELNMRSDVLELLDMLKEEGYDGF